MKRLMMLATLCVVPAVVLGQDGQGRLQSMAMKVGETRRFLQDQGHGDVLPLVQATFRRVGAETLCVDLVGSSGVLERSQILSSPLLESLPSKVSM